MHLRAFLKALLFVRLAIGVAWSAEVPAANTPADAPNVGEIFQHTVGQVDLLTKAREAAGRPGGPVEVFFRRLRVEPSFRATVKAKAFAQNYGGPVAVTLLLVRDDEREMLVHTGEASGNELKLTEHLQLGQSYRFPHVCAAAGVPINPDAKEAPAGVPAVMTLFENLTQLQALPLASGMLHNFTGASPPHEPHFLASSLRRCPPFRGTVVRKASSKLEDGKVAVSVAFYRPDALPMTITEVGAAPETQRFVDFLKEGESYDFPAILDKVDGVQFPPVASGSKSELPELFHQLFRQPGWNTQTEEFLRARAPDGTLPTPPSLGAAPFIPTTPEEKALDRYVGAWGTAIQESASGEFRKGKLGAMITLRRWTMDGKQLRFDSFAWPDLRAGSGEPPASYNHVRPGFVGLYCFDSAASHFCAIDFRPEAGDKLIGKLMNTGHWDKASQTFTWTSAKNSDGRYVTMKTSFPEDGVMVNTTTWKDASGSLKGERRTRSRREHR